MRDGQSTEGDDIIEQSVGGGQNGELLATVLLILYSVVIYVEPSFTPRVNPM